MSTIETTVCDRCGKTTTGPAAAGWMKGVLYGPVPARIDLCRDCTARATSKPTDPGECQ